MCKDIQRELVGCSVCCEVMHQFSVTDVSMLLMFCLQTVQQRGAAVIQARKLSSAMSAAKATCDHLRDWWHGTKEVS